MEKKKLGLSLSVSYRAIVNKLGIVGAIFLLFSFSQSGLSQHGKESSREIEVQKKPIHKPKEIVLEFKKPERMKETIPVVSWMNLMKQEEYIENFVTDSVKRWIIVDNIPNTLTYQDIVDIYNLPKYMEINIFEGLLAINILNISNHPDAKKTSSQKISSKEREEILKEVYESISTIKPNELIAFRGNTLVLPNLAVLGFNLYVSPRAYGRFDNIDTSKNPKPNIRRKRTIDAKVFKNCKWKGEGNEQ